jgi:hypothetical protein
MLFDLHVSYFASCTGCAMINLAIRNQTPADSTPQPYVQHDAFGLFVAALFSRRGGRSRLYFCQCRSIGIVIYYTGYIKFLNKIILQREIIPTLRMVQGAYYTLRGIYQPADSDAGAQYASITQPLGSRNFREHLIE